MEYMYNNLISTAVLSCKTENPNYPVENLVSLQLAERYQSVGNEEWIKAVLPAPVMVSRVVIAGHNLSASASVSIQANTTDSWDTPALSLPMTRKAGIQVLRMTPVSYRYWRIVITDSGNDHIYIGGLFIGEHLEAPPMKPDQNIGLNAEADPAFSSSGQVYGSSDFVYRDFGVKFPCLTNEQRQCLDTMFRVVQNVIPVYCVIWPGDETLETPIYCVLDQKKLGFERTEYPGFPWSLQVKHREVF